MRYALRSFANVLTVISLTLIVGSSVMMVKVANAITVVTADCGTFVYNQGNNSYGCSADCSSAGKQDYCNEPKGTIEDKLMKSCKCIVRP